MASSTAPVQPYRYLALFLALLIGAYLLVFLTGDKKAEPKLGIDLQGGTRVTLTARTPDGSRPSADALKQAQQIIGARVDGLGVSGSEVVIDNDNLVITVPGNDGNEARALGQTARLFVRPVVQAASVEQVRQMQNQLGQQPGAPGAPGLPEGMPGLPEGMPGLPGVPGLPAEAPADTPAPADAPAPQPRPYPLEPVTPSPEPSPAPGETAGTPAEQAPAEPTEEPAEEQTEAPAVPASPEDKDRAARINFEQQLRQNPNQNLLLLLAMPYVAERCGQEDVLAGNDDPDLPLVTCSQDGQTVYLLDRSIISGEEIKDATSGLDQQSAQNVVDLEFTGNAVTVWADFTAANVGTQTAFTLDSQVVSAPQIRQPIPGGRTQITGNFTQEEAKQLANVLKYGSLPLSFESSEAETVSATLGLSSLRAGLIAGAVGLILTLVYALVYYRALGLLVALSLVAAGAMVYAILVLLGRYIGYTLDIAGVAGLIIGIGMTADSFVVFFERIKDEIREGRSFRSAVPRGWTRARKTILSGNAVSFIAAAVLYFLAVGQVKGFAFTLGLTTILDVVVVFLVTWPLVYLASKSATMAKPAFNGLGAVQQIARERRAVQSAGRG